MVCVNPRLYGEQHRTVQLVVGLHCSPLNHPGKLFPSVCVSILASVCLVCLWSFRWHHVLSILCSSVYFVVWHNSRYCILHDFIMLARLELHTAVEDFCRLGCDDVSRLYFRRFEGSYRLHLNRSAVEEEIFLCGLHLGLPGPGDERPAVVLRAPYTLS
jgi:hypothetical protein